MAVRTNLCKYPSMEAGTTTATGWGIYTNSGATSTLTVEEDPATPGRTKNQGWAITCTQANKSSWFYISTGYSPAATFNEGDYCAVSAYMKGALVGCTIKFSVRWMASASLISAETSSNFTLTSSYQQFTFVTAAGAPATTNQVQLYILVQDLHNTDTADIDIDCVMIENATTAGAYFDGETADTAEHVYAWGGTADASYSTDTYTPAASSTPIHLLRPHIIPAQIGGL